MAVDVRPHARVASRDGARRVGAPAHRGRVEVGSVEVVEPTLKGQLAVGGAAGDGAEEPVEAGSAERPEDVGEFHPLNTVFAPCYKVAAV